MLTKDGRMRNEVSRSIRALESALESTKGVGETAVTDKDVHAKLGEESTKEINFDSLNQTKYDRTIPPTIEDKRSAINRIVDSSKILKNNVERAVIDGITKRQEKDFAEKGIIIDKDYVHSIDKTAIIHNQKKHGDPKKEAKKGQIAITKDDYARIPEILEAYDDVRKSPNLSHSTQNEVIVYEKEFEDGCIFYLEEKRDGRKSLAFQTLYKKKKELIVPTGCCLMPLPLRP